jgi:pilus assembly protein Flp/PilA
MAKLTDQSNTTVRILKNSRGQTLIEYGLLLILIAVVVIAGVTAIGKITNNSYSAIGNAIP